MDGGPSQVDTFDYKPLLAKHHGEDPRRAMGKLEPTQFNNIGKVMKSPWEFHRRGASGNWVSDLFPHLQEHIDELAFLKAMTSKFSEHTSANCGVILISSSPLRRSTISLAVRDSSM